MAFEKIYHQTITNIDKDGTTSTSQIETIEKIERLEEPDFIKLYTKTWCSINSIPSNLIEFFLQLAIRMTYCNAKDLENSQIVQVTGPIREDIMKAMGWTTSSMLNKWIKKLCDHGAIKPTKYKSTYQINPTYAAKGSWHFDSKKNNGGIKDLVKTFKFDFNTCTVTTSHTTNSTTTIIYTNPTNTEELENT